MDNTVIISVIKCYYTKYLDNEALKKAIENECLKFHLKGLTLEEYNLIFNQLEQHFTMVKEKDRILEEYHKEKEEKEKHRNKHRKSFLKYFIK